jgi:tetratricopeptide (TPR) repeat protein
MRGVDILPVINELSQSELEDADLVYRQFVDFLMKRWSPDSPFDSDEYVRFHAARIAIGRDDLIRAGELIETLEFASSRLRVQIEREFATFWIEDEAELQAHIREGAQNAMSLYDTLAEDNPGFIEPLALKAQALSQLGRPQDALTELEAVREGVFTGELIEDVGDQMAWLLNDMAEAHQNLGDMDEAIAIMREAASLSEYGFDNVSQRTNLAWMLAVSGNEEAALAQIDDIDLTLTSSFGEGLVLTTRICAQHFLGRNDGLEADLAALEASGMVTSNLRQFAYACLDDRERAAALLIERLEHPKARTEALADLQDYQDIETEYHGPNHAALKAHDAALLARPDVAAAVEAAGRIIAPGVAF